MRSSPDPHRSPNADRRHDLAVLGHYVVGKLRDQVMAVLPISAFLILFQLVVMRQPVRDALTIGLGLTLVILGLTLFMEGLRLGLMPLGQNIGATLPVKARLGVILAFAFVLGVAATLAEPAISTIRAVGSNLHPEDGVLLYEMLTRSSMLLVGAVAVGVGIATGLGIYRFVANWSLKRLLLPSLTIALLATVAAQLHPATRGLIPMAWDTGAVTTGPVTVPLVLALGLGVSAVLGKSPSGSSGFGIVTLASLWPITIVLLAGLLLFYTGNVLAPEEAQRAAQAMVTTGAGAPTFVDLVGTAMQAAVQAIIPLGLLLFVVQRLLLREEIRNLPQILLGAACSLLGLLCFNLGLGSGLVPLGEQAGGSLPIAFTPPEQLYGETGGRLLALGFAFLLGYGATLAEPALNALGLTVEQETHGAFRKALLMQAVAIGIGFGLAAGLAKVLFDVPIVLMLLPSYLALILITLCSEETYVNIGWDSAGVTTGPITVPLVLAMGLGVGTAVGAPEGFGMLAMSSAGPIFTVLLFGLLASAAQRRRAAVRVARAPEVSRGQLASTPLD